MDHLLQQTDELVDLVPSHELLAVLEITRRVATELAERNCGNHFVAFTDGSCTPHDNGSPEGQGGWATIIFGPRGEKWEMHGSIPFTTSNRAEVCALLAALTAVPFGIHLGIQSDSRYVVDHVRAACRASDNQDLWFEVREMLVAKDVKLSAAWVAGHSGHRHNERADALASAGAPRRRRNPVRSLARIS